MGHFTPREWLLSVNTRCRQLLFLWCLLVLPVPGAGAEEYRVLRSKQAKVLYPPELAGAAQEISRILPGIRADLFALFHRRIEARPTIVLMADPKVFRRMAGHALVVAYAVPAKDLIVLDYSRISRRPFRLQTTLTHEMCHLLLHAHIEPDRLPRWLEEGLCQWASGGVDELMLSPKNSRLNRRALAGRLLPLAGLETSFPGEPASFQLAYEQSKGFVSWLVKAHGKEAVLALLDHLAGGDTLAGSAYRATGVPLASLESRWHGTFGRTTAWLVFFSRHVYELLFLIAALATVAGYVRYRIRKRNYVDAEDEI
jgi:Peptidase MA superfamily